MRGIIIRWLILAASIVISSYILEGIEVQGVLPVLGAAAVLGFLNAFFRPLLLVLTLPVNVLSLGFFTFIINAMMLKMASSVIPGFDVRGFWTALFGSLVISIVSWVLNAFVNERGRVEYIDMKQRGRDRWE